MQEAFKLTTRSLVPKQGRKKWEEATIFHMIQTI